MKMIMKNKIERNIQIEDLFLVTDSFVVIGDVDEGISTGGCSCWLIISSIDNHSIDGYI
jgi:hypothetical protein